MRLGLLNCGGTITERYRPDGTLDRLGAHDLAGLTGPTAWAVHDVEAVDSSDLTFASVCGAREAMRRDRESGAFVLCCGTDAMEDMAYASALLLDRDRPIVLTGAALPGGSEGSDALSNLRDAALLARAMPSGAGPLVAFAGRAFDPVCMVKIWPQAVQPFGPDVAVRGAMAAGLVTLTGGCGKADSYADLDAADLDARVAIVTETFGPLAGFLDADALDGLVVAGKGAGGIAAGSEADLRRAAARIPVVLSTRCPQGFHVNPAVAKHAFERAHALGLVTAGYEGLNASKACIRLVAELGRVRSDRRKAEFGTMPTL